MARGANRLLTAMRKAGLPITPDAVNDLKWEMIDRLWGRTTLDGEPEGVAELINEANKLLASWQHLDEPDEPKPEPPPPSPVAWARQREFSTAATWALRDRLQASHRPGGRIMRRPRWSADEEPPFGFSKNLISTIKQIRGEQEEPPTPRQEANADMRRLVKEILASRSE